MTPAQLKRIYATESQITENPRKSYWHYRRSPATSHRDAIWQYANRPTDGEWETIPRPDAAVLERLEPLGSMQRDGIRWQGFHDPAEFALGY